MTSTVRITCRLCHEGKLEPIFSLGDIYVSTFNMYPDDENILCPLTLSSCTKCGLVQLSHTAPQELMYTKKYWYKSGINKTISNDLAEIAQEAEKYMYSGDTILDIGANDGTLLSYIPKEYRRVACEPAQNLKEELAGNCDVLIDDFWSAELYRGKKAKVVTAIGMFYDLEDPNQFVGDIEKVLTHDGIFIAQLTTLAPMLKNNDIGNICHEHLEYYAYRDLVRLYEQNGLEIFRVEENRINGGSYRVFARKLKSGSMHYVEEDDIDGFIKRIQINRDGVLRMVDELKKRNMSIYGYGASTKGNTIIQWYGLELDGISDANPEKFGKYTPKTNTIVIPEDEARERADAFLVLPWGFQDQFILKERKLGFTGPFILHTPTAAYVA